VNEERSLRFSFSGGNSSGSFRVAVEK